jgi:hypothetical protein
MKTRIVPAILLLAGSLSAQESLTDLDLSWRLPHERAVIYDVADPVTGTRKNDFWLLACELESRVGATDFSDLPLRFVFRQPKKKVPVKGTWEVKELAFGDAPVVHPGVSPVEVVGVYRLTQVKKVRLEELFKAAVRGRKEKSEPVEVALIEGHFNLHRVPWVQWQLGKPEQVPSSTLTTLTAVRLPDKAIVGGRYQFSGRNELYEGKWSGPRVGRGNDAREFLIREPLIETTKAGLKPMIDKAVENGVKWLRAQQAADGSIADPAGYAVGTSGGLGATAMSLQALLHSGVPADDPAIRKGFAYLAGRKQNQSYDLGLLLMALEAKYLPMSMLEDLETYSEDKARAAIAQKITREDREIAESAVRTLLETQHTSGLFGYTAGGANPNLSSAQYSVLGLKSASRMGMSVSNLAWRKSVAYLMESAVTCPYGVSLEIERWDNTRETKNLTAIGWGYSHPKYSAPTGTMTAAGLSILAICNSELARLKNWTEQDSKLTGEATACSLGWLQHFYSVRASTPEGCGYAPAMSLYYLYGLERACVLWDVKKFGGHDWYHEGAAILISWQNKDSRWEGPLGNPVIDTAWALLFLKRATIPVETYRKKVASVDSQGKPEK